MATIEERAHQYGCKAAGGWYKGGMRGSVYKAHYDAYIEIATEQRKIDIDKACQEFKYFLNQLLTKDINCFRPDILRGDIEVWYEEFKQAMEE